MMRRGPDGPRTLCNACGLAWANKVLKILVVLCCMFIYLVVCTNVHSTTAGSVVAQPIYCEEVLSPLTSISNNLLVVYSPAVTIYPSVPSITLDAGSMIFWQDGFNFISNNVLTSI